MPKIQEIDPKEVRRKSTIKFKPIPLNQYSKTLSAETANFSKEELLGIQRDMFIIRVFESMLNEIKLRESYHDVEYNHRGPAHLSIGQEAEAVGQAFLLGVDDHIFGSHRSHGEILAKGLSAINKLNDEKLMEIMKGYFDGDCLSVVEKDASGSVKDLAVDFIIYGALAEIFARISAFTRSKTDAGELTCRI